MKIYSVKDAESQTFIPCFTMPTDRDAIDSFRHVVNNEKESPYHKFPKDYSLYNLGSFDLKTGEITLNPKETQIKLALAYDLMTKE